MNQVWEFFSKLFESSDWPPRWHCGKWTEFHGWLYIISDLLIWSAYFSIPLVIIKYISKKQGIKFVRLYFLFAAFILACGSTHFFDAVSFWFPLYRVNALARLVTGVLSWITVFSLVRVLPTAFSLRSQQDLETEIDQRKKAEAELRGQEQIMALFVKHTPAAVAMFDNDMCYVHASDRWYTDYKLTGRDIIGKSHYDVIPEIKKMHEWIAIHQRCLNGAIEKKDEELFQRADGGIDWLQWEIHPWRKQDGSIGGIIMFTEIITEKILQQQRIEEEKRKRQQYILKANIDGQEQERDYINKELHDNINQVLSGVKLHLALIKQGDEHTMLNTVKNCIGHLNDAMEEIMKLTRTMSSSVMKEMGLVEAMTVLKNETRFLKACNIKFVHSGDFASTPLDMSLSIFRIAQEHLDNIIKHSQAGNVAISLDIIDSIINLRIIDDGIGANLTAKQELKGIGLPNIRNRVLAHNGTIDIRSNPGEGFEVSIELSF